MAFKYIVNFENILVRMPEQLDYFLAASAVVQDYWVQQNQQRLEGEKQVGFKLFIEVADDSFMFLTPVFPTMELRVFEADPKRSEDWACVLDMRDVESALRLARSTRRHVAEVWGFMFGACSPRAPELGGLNDQANNIEFDVLIDRNLESADKLISYLTVNNPELRVKLQKVDGLRCGAMFTLLARTRAYVGVRGGASYLAAVMGKAVVEQYPDDLPPYFLSKPAKETNRLIYGNEVNAELIWQQVDEVINILNGKVDDFSLTPQQMMTVARNV